MSSDRLAPLRKFRETNLKRLLVFGGLFLLLSAGGLFVIYREVAEQTFAFDSRLLSLETLVAIALLLAVYFTADGLRLHFTLKALGHSLPLSHIFRLVFINIFFSNITPLASGGGFAQIWYLRRQRVPLGTATTATTIRTVLAILFIFTATPVLMFSLDALAIVRIDPRLYLYLALFVAIYIAFFAVVLFRTRWLVPPTNTLLYGLRRMNLISSRRHRLWRFGSKRETLRFARGFRDYLFNGGVNVALSILFTLVFLLSLFSFPAVLMWGLDYSVNYFTVIGLMVVTTFTMYFSPTPGASGIAEGIFGYLFATLASANHLLLITVSWRFLTIYLGMLIGVLVIQRELARPVTT